VVEEQKKVIEAQLEAMETKLKTTEDQQSLLKDANENLEKSVANPGTQVRDLDEVGLEGYSEGFKKAARQVVYFEPSLDSSKFILEKDVVDGKLIDD